jgi:ABC-type transport system substrate-binding protein
VAYTSEFFTPVWDAFTWDEFSWDGVTLAPSEVEMKGTAENYQITIRADVDYVYPFTINSSIVHYSFRRRVR